MTLTEVAAAPSLDDARRAAAAGASQVLLFCSVARGTQDAGSDIDLVAVFDDLDYAARWERMAAPERPASHAAGCRVEVHVTDRPGWAVRSRRLATSAAWSARFAADRLVGRRRSDAAVSEGPRRTAEEARQQAALIEEVLNGWDLGAPSAPPRHPLADRPDGCAPTTRTPAELRVAAAASAPVAASRLRRRGQGTGAGRGRRRGRESPPREGRSPPTADRRGAGRSSPRRPRHWTDARPCRAQTRCSRAGRAKISSTRGAKSPNGRSSWCGSKQFWS